MQPGSPNCSRYVKAPEKVSVKRIILFLVVLFLFTVTVVHPTFVYATTVGDGWYSRDREVNLGGSSGTVSTGEDTATKSQNGEDQKKGYISEQVAKFMRSLGDGITDLLKTDQVDFSLDGVVLGRLAAKNSSNVSAAQFELAYRNPWGIVGAYLYVTFRSIAYAAFVILFLIVLFPQAVKGDGRSISETKALIGNTVIMFALLYFFPWIVDWCLYLRDAAMSVMIRVLSDLGLNGGNVGNSLIDYFRERAKGVTTQVPLNATEYAAWVNAHPNADASAIPMHNVETIDLGSCFLYVVACCLGIVWLASYLSTAIIQTGLFGLFPLFALLSIKDNRQTLKHFSGIFFINMLIPLIDSFLLMTPGVVASILCGGTIAKENVGVFLMQLILMWGILPARMVILRAFGRAFGIDARANGVIGLASLGIALGSAAISAGRNIASSGKLSHSGADHSSLKTGGISAKEAAADALNNQAILTTAKRDASTDLADVKTILGDDYGKNSSITPGERGVGGTLNERESVFSSNPERGGLSDLTAEDGIHGGGINQSDDLFGAGSEHEPGISSIDRIRSENLDARDQMMEELDDNTMRLNGMDIHGMETEVRGMEDEANGLEKRNEYLQREIDQSLSREMDDAMTHHFGNMNPAGAFESAKREDMMKEMSDNASRITELRGQEVKGSNGETIRIGGEINAKMGKLNDAYALQARNNDLRVGIDKSNRIEKNLAAASGAAGMSDQVFASKAQFNYQKAADINHAKMATYKNYMSSDFSKVVTPEQRAMFAKQQQEKERWQGTSRLSGAATRIAVTAGVGAAAVAVGAAAGPQGMLSGAVLANGAGTLAGSAVNRTMDLAGNVSAGWKYKQAKSGMHQNDENITAFTETQEFHGTKGEKRVTEQKAPTQR